MHRLRDDRVNDGLASGCRRARLGHWHSQHQPARRQRQSHPLERRTQARVDIVTRGIGDWKCAVERPEEDDGVLTHEPPPRRLDVVHARGTRRLADERELLITSEKRHAVPSESALEKRCSRWMRVAPNFSICRRLAPFTSAIQVMPSDS